MSESPANPPATRIVGTPQIRKEGVDKVLGRAKYTDDLEREGMWHGATVRSTIPRGHIRAIHYDPHIPWSEFVLVTHADIPGQNHIQMIAADQPCLVETQVNHCDEPILLLAHPDKRRLPEAVAAIRIEYDPLPAVLSIEESETQQEIVWGSDNIFKQFHLEKGNVDETWANAAHIVEGEYTTGAQEHLYIENNGMIAEYSEVTGITVRGSLQCPFYVHKSLMAVFDLPAEKVRVIQVETGGAFGGKEDYPSIIASHAGLLGEEGKAPHQDRLRPNGRPSRHHQATPLPYASSHRRRQRRQASRHGDRHRHRRRRLRHALVHCPLPSHAPRLRPLRLPQHPHHFQRLGHQHRSLRRIPRLRRAAVHLRHRAPHGSDRPRHRHQLRTKSAAATSSTPATPPPPSSA
jgi:hypothetical protein